MVSDSTLESLDTYYTIAFLVVVVLIVLTVKAEHRWKKKDSKNAKMATYALLVTIIIISATTAVVCTWVALYGTRYEYTYRASVTSKDDEGVVYLPLPTNEELRETLQITRGNGPFSIVETEHGLAMMLAIEDLVIVSGEVLLDHPMDDWTLTMPSDSEDDMTWVGLVMDDYNNGTPSVSISMIERVWPGDDDDYGISAHLAFGWRAYDVRDMTRP